MAPVHAFVAFINGIIGETVSKYGAYGIEQFLAESKKYKLDKSVYLECGFDDPSTTEVKAVQA